MPKRILIAILNWNGFQHLKCFLPSVISHSPEADILIIDNHSTDNSIDYITRNYPDIKIVVHSENFGFTGGYNRALIHFRNYDFYLLLNNDVEVTPGWLRPMIRFMDENPKVAATQPKMLQYHHKNMFEYSGACGGHLDGLGYPFCRGRIFDAMETDHGQYNDNEKIFWACGAALMIRAEAFHKSGGFDENFFAHMEEIDLCWRLQRMGYEIYVCPESMVYHVGGATLGSKSVKKYYLNIRNSLLCLLKNYPGIKCIFILIARLALDGCASVFFLLKGNPAVLRAVLWAHGAFYRNIPKYLKIRSKMKSSDLYSCKIYPDHPFSVVWAFYLKKIKTYQDLINKYPIIRRNS